MDDKKPSAKRKARKPKTADERHPTTKQILKANSLGLNIQNEVAKFRNVAASRPKPYGNLDRAFDNRLPGPMKGCRGTGPDGRSAAGSGRSMRTVMEIAAQSAANGTDQPTYSEGDFR